MNAVQEYIATQRLLQKEIMSVLRTWFLDLGTHTKEKVSYKVPYFYFHGPLGYLKPTVDGVDLWLIQGKSMNRTHSQVVIKGNKGHGFIRLHSLAELEEQEEELRKILNEAAILNQYLFNQKTKKK